MDVLSNNLLVDIILTFITGLVIKYADDLEDLKRNINKRSYALVLAIIWGSILGYLMSQAPYSTILIAAVFAMVIMRKIDTPSHILGILISIAIAIMFGLPYLDIWIFATFVLFACIDEWDDFIFFDKPDFVKDFRPFLEIGAIIVGLATWNWIYLLGILSFDIGYISTMLITKSNKAEENEKIGNRAEKITKRTIKHKNKTKKIIKNKNRNKSKTKNRAKSKGKTK